MIATRIIMLRQPNQTWLPLINDLVYTKNVSTINVKKKLKISVCLFVLNKNKFPFE